MMMDRATLVHEECNAVITFVLFSLAGNERLI